MRICFCGYDFFASALEALLDKGHTLVEVFTWPTDNEYDFNRRVFECATRMNARVTVSPMQPEDLVRLKKNGVDAIIAAAYPFKVPDWAGYLPYALNVHPSPLPEGRGPWPIPWLILKRCSEGAVTIHKISPKWDCGDILAQERFPLSGSETLESVSLRSQMVAERLVCQVIDDIGSFWTNATPQEGGSYWHMPKKEDRTIELSMKIEQIDKIVRAFSKFEPFIFLDGIRHFVRKVDVWSGAPGVAPGTRVLTSSRENVYAAADGFVALTHIVRADEK